jgi:2-amino-4-hydroxy-6-hydroxymethyldihydropteridine diphosphokinase
LGRQRKEKWGPRTIDLDILLWGEECLNTKELIVPHPYLQQRLFVLLPLVEINPDLMLPTGESIKEVLSTVYDREGGNKIKKL